VLVAPSRSHTELARLSRRRFVARDLVLLSQTVNELIRRRDPLSVRRGAPRAHAPRGADSLRVLPARRLRVAGGDSRRRRDRSAPPPVMMRRRACETIAIADPCGCREFRPTFTDSLLFLVDDNSRSSWPASTSIDSQRGRPGLADGGPRGLVRSTHPSLRRPQRDHRHRRGTTVCVFHHLPPIVCLGELSSTVILRLGNLIVAPLPAWPASSRGRSCARDRPRGPRLAVGSSRGASSSAEVGVLRALDESPRPPTKAAGGRSGRRDVAASVDHPKTLTWGIGWA